MDILYTSFPQFLSLTFQVKTRVMKPLSLSIIGYKCWSYRTFGSRILQPSLSSTSTIWWVKPHGVKPPPPQSLTHSKYSGVFSCDATRLSFLASSSLTMMRKTPWQMLHVVSSLSHSWSLEEIVPSKFYFYCMSYPQIHIFVIVGGFRWYFQTTSFAKRSKQKQLPLFALPSIQTYQYADFDTKTLQHE